MEDFGLGLNHKLSPQVLIFKMIMTSATFYLDIKILVLDTLYQLQSLLLFFSLQVIQPFSQSLVAPTSFRHYSHYLFHFSKITF